MARVRWIEEGRTTPQAAGMRGRGHKELKWPLETVKGKEIDSAFRSFKDVQSREYLDLSSVKPIYELLKPEV